MLQLFWLLDKDNRKEFRQKGYLFFENILNQKDYEIIKKMVYSDKFGEHFIKEGSTLVKRHYVSSEILKKIENKKLKKLLKYISSVGSYPLMGFESVCQSKQSTKVKDTQSNWHRDTFHPCVKGWLYFNDVDSNNGSFEYLEGSHKLTLKRIIWEYKESLLACKNHSRGYDGAFRISENDIKRSFKLNKSVTCKVPEGTLVVANVFGFHRRGDVSLRGSEVSRSSLWFQARSYPFSPFPLRALSGVRTYIAQSYRKREYKQKLSKHKGDL
ncbi:hypothetical protein [Francisella uliginis]|uniref:hypothetical protein n=1 Tax=Francisella uliginis TaxID=573570 RepID=UPI000AFF54FE|nr:hypothetical protein [Francisella uliginis]